MSLASRADILIVEGEVAIRAFSRDQLLERVHDGDGEIGARSVDVHVRRLRKVLEEVGLDHLVQTVRGVGYRFSGRA